MARNTTVSVDSTGWTQLTDADCTGFIIAQVVSSGGQDVLLKATADTTAPTTDDGAYRLSAPFGTPPGATLATLFPGITGADRLWAKAASSSPARVFISHA
jgi:hypothetical protein